METLNCNEQQGVLATQEKVEAVMAQLSPGTIAYFVLKLFEEKQLLPEREAIDTLKRYLGITDQNSEIYTAKKNTNGRIARYGLQIEIYTNAQGKKEWGVFLKERNLTQKAMPAEPGIRGVMDALIERIRTKLGLEDTPENTLIIAEAIRTELRKRFPGSQPTD